MKRIAIYLFSSLSLICSAALPASGATVSETLAEIERNSLTLRATAASNEATELELRADNTLPPLSVEYSPFFRSGVSGVASSEMVVSQEFDFPTLYGVRNRQASAERAALDGAAAAERRAFRQDARSRLLTLLLLRKEREILDMRIADAEALLALYEKSLENGKSTILEVNKVKLELQELRRELLQNSADLQAQADALQGLNGGQPIDLSDLEQIRWKRARPVLALELEQHLADQTEAFQAEGQDKDTAVRLALEDMGDPVEVGTELDRVHRPRPQWGLLGLTFVLAAIGAFLRVEFLQASPYPSREQVLVKTLASLATLGLGTALMMGAYFLDVSRLVRHARTVYIGTLAMTVLLLLYPTYYNALMTTLYPLVQTVLYLHDP